jgi:hypothetical protein
VPRPTKKSSSWSGWLTTHPAVVNKLPLLESGIWTVRNVGGNSAKPVYSPKQKFPNEAAHLTLLLCAGFSVQESLTLQPSESLDSWYHFLEDRSSVDGFNSTDLDKILLSSNRRLQRGRRVKFVNRRLNHTKLHSDSRNEDLLLLHIGFRLLRHAISGHG